MHTPVTPPILRAAPPSHRAGTNDLGSRFDSTPGAICASVGRLHALAREGGVTRTLAIGIPESRFASGDSPFNEKRCSTNALIEAMAREVSGSGNGHTCTYIDCPLTFDASNGLFEGDGLHMTKAGYQELGRRLAAPVAALVLGADAKGKAETVTRTEPEIETGADTGALAAEGHAPAAAGAAPAVDLEQLSKTLDNCDCVYPPSAERAHGTQTPFVAEGGERNYDTPLLYLGNRRVAEDAASLRLLGCTHVVNAAPSQVASVLAAAEECGPAYLHVDLDDRVEAVDAAATRAAFDEAAAFIDAAMRGADGSVVLVHCAGGVSRSASIVLFFLIAKRGMSLAGAWRVVREAREVIGPNAAFFNVLLDAERELTGKGTMQRPLNDQQRCFSCLGAA